MYLLVDASGVIQHAQPNQPAVIPSGQTLVQVPDTTAYAQECLARPTAYAWDGTAIVMRPYWTIAYASFTVTATLNLPPATPPTSCTITVLGTSQTAPVSSGEATTPLAVHPSVATQAIVVTASADGTYGGSLDIGGGASGIALQIYTPSGGIPTVAPTGAGSLEFLQAYYASSISAARQPRDLATANALLQDIAFGADGPIAAIVASGAWKPTAAQQASLSWIQSNILPSSPVTLATALDGSGNPVQPVAQYASDLALAKAAFQHFAEDVASIPNLA